MKKAILALADGTWFEGRALGAEGETGGEVVFNTAMTGYQEVLTDPSYRGQIVTMTSPHIGNYGVNPEDIESGRIWAEGFVVKESSRAASNWRSQGDAARIFADGQHRRNRRNRYPSAHYAPARKRRATGRDLAHRDGSSPCGGKGSASAKHHWSRSGRYCNVRTALFLDHRNR